MRLVQSASSAAVFSACILHSITSLMQQWYLVGTLWQVMQRGSLCCIPASAQAVRKSLAVQLSPQDVCQAVDVAGADAMPKSWRNCRDHQGQDIQLKSWPVQRVAQTRQTPDTKAAVVASGMAQHTVACQQTC